MNNGTKKANIVIGDEDGKRVTVRALPFRALHTTPMLFATDDISAAKLNTSWITWPDPLRNFIELTRKPMGASLEYTQASQNYVSVGRVLDRT